MALALDFVSFMESLGSVQFEVMILITFLVSWAASRMLSKRHTHGAAKSKLGTDQQDVSPPSWQSKPVQKHHQDIRRQQEAERTAAQIMALSQDQFTRALQLYRQMVRSGIDKEIKDHKFYFTLIHASVRVGKADVAGQLLWSMKRIGVQCPPAFFESVLKLFSSRRFFPQCRQLCKLYKDELPAEKTVCSCLAFAAAESNDTEIANAVLDIIRKAPDAFTGKDCVNLFRVFQKHVDADGAVKLLRQLQELKIPLETVLILNIVLATCVLAGQTDRGREILSQAKSGELLGVKVDTISYNTLLKGFSSAQETEKCFELLDDMATSGVEPDDVTYSILVDGCIANGEFDLNLASEALDKLMKDGKPRNAVLHTTMINRFVRSNMLDRAMQLYGIMKASSAKPDLITYSILIKGHCNTRQMDVALTLLEDMVQAGYQPDDLVVTHLLEGCCHVGNVALGEKLFEDTVGAGKVEPSVYTLVTMVKLYGRCGLCDKALELVSNMERQYKLKPTIIIFTCLMSGFVRNKRYEDAFDVLTQFKAAGLKPDEMTYTTAIDACKQGGKLDKVLELILEAFDAKVDLQWDLMNVALSQMLRVSQIGLAQRLFDAMRAHNVTCTVPKASRQLQLKPGGST